MIQYPQGLGCLFESRSTLGNNGGDAALVDLARDFPIGGWDESLELLELGLRWAEKVAQVVPHRVTIIVVADLHVRVSDQVFVHQVAGLPRVSDLVQVNSTVTPEQDQGEYATKLHLRGGYIRHLNGTVCDCVTADKKCG